MSTLIELHRRRGSYKKKLTQFKEYLATVVSLDTLSNVVINNLQMRLSKIEELYSEYDSVQLDIEGFDEITDAELEKEFLDRQRFETDYFAAVAEARELLSRHASTGGGGSDCGGSSVSGGPSIKLPTIHLPTFSGEYEDWLEFHDTFVSIIHSSENIPKIHKFHYLRAALRDKAVNVISSLDFSAKNYDIAWQLLCERYQNDKLLISNHIQAILDIEPIMRESSVALRNIIDIINKNLRSLKTLKVDTKNWDILIIHIVSSKFDPTSVRKWKEQMNSCDDLPTLEHFIKFLKNRSELLETINQSNTKRRSSEPMNNRPRAFVANFNTQGQPSSYCCPLCKQNHPIYQCQKFKLLSVQNKIHKANQLRLCLNCLRQGHDSRRCRLSPCRICYKYHNTMLHTDSQPAHGNPNEGKPDGEDVVVLTAQDENETLDVSETESIPESVQEDVVLSSIHRSCVLLSTALIDVVDQSGKRHTVRALLDNGSTSSFMTQKLSNTLKLPIHSTSTSVEGLSRNSLHITKRSSVTIHSRTEPFTIDINCFIVPQITQFLPLVKINALSLNIPKDIVLADPTFNIPSEIDMLLNAEIFWSVLGNQRITLGKNKPTLNATKLGWLVSGAMHLPDNSPHSAHLNVNHCHFLNEVDLQNQLNRFFELESVPSSRLTTKDENECEQHFNETTKRQEDGRFIVQIPMKKSPETLGTSYDQALTRFQSLERRLQRDPAFKEKYSEFIQEYINLGHMSLNNDHNDKYSYILPHHGVLRESSITTKLRVVFDASARTTSGVSFNDIQHIGPTVQDDLISILVRFRQHKYVVTSDCEKMYRCVLVAKEQRCLQQILWRFDPTEELKLYKLNTVTYGTASAPYLATRCLLQLGLECPEPLIRETILRDFYVDDYISGHDSESTLLQICQGVVDQLKKGQFYVRKWRSNNPRVLDEIHVNDGNDNLLKLINDDNAKTLGLRWSCKSDTLTFAVDSDSSTKNLSKRSVLSIVGQVFDPLGLVSPCILQAKILLQQLWASKISWDEPLPSDIHKNWLIFLKSLPQINDIVIPRRVSCDSPVCIEIHAFSDASLQAYSACVYLRTTSRDYNTSVHLIMAKSRVAPLKGMTVPRLELCGALLAVRLAQKIKNAFRLVINSWNFWCDSTIVLGWIRAPRSTLKAFVCNRINEITEQTDANVWRYVPTNLNPADIGSRGCNASQLKPSNLWWSGPEFLSKPRIFWPTQPNYTSMPADLPETKVQCNISRQTANFIHAFSNFGRLQRVTAYILRFAHNCRHPTNKTSSHLKASELSSATSALCRLVQMDMFPDEYINLINNRTLPVKSSLLNLNPFMAEQNVIRVGGRLSNSNYDYDTKYPILIHASHHVTKLLFKHYHRILMHAGPQLLLSILRHKFWTISGRNLARKITHDCHTCCRFTGKSIQPIMANLPKERLQADFPFGNTAVDYAGPILLADRKGRGSRLIKSYICVFVCLAVRAVHIELVTDLSTEAFIAALNRFIARRGRPLNMFSDNGTNFVGAFNELSKFLKAKCDGLSALASEQAINFKFSPAYSPHFNGLAEGSVKSVKYHLKRVLSLAHLTYEEMNTVLIQIEGILNSRPLTPLSSDPNDLIPLTPSHFLIGRTIAMLPSSQVDLERKAQICSLPRYQRAKILATHFWNRYYREYISELQKRTKWQRNNQETLRIGDMVLIKDDRLPPNRWLLGRITCTYTGPDGIARVADVITSSGTIRRAYNRLCLLPISSSLEQDVPKGGAC